MKITALLLCLVAIGQAQWAPRRAPGFCLADTTGQWRDLADYRGKVVLVEFMQTTCPHCAAFTDTLAALNKKYGDRLQILAIALPNDTPQTMMQYAAGHKLPYPLLFDMGQVTASYVRAPGMEFPTVYLVDANGMIRGNWSGVPTNKEIFEGNGLSVEIDKLLAPATPAQNAPSPKKK